MFHFYAIPIILIVSNEFKSYIVPISILQKHGMIYITRMCSFQLFLQVRLYKCSKIYGK